MKNMYFIALLAMLAISCKKDQAIAENSGQQTDKKSVAAVSTIVFSGLTWNVKDVGNTTVGPGPNYWSGSSVWVDAQGFLHLKLKKDPATGRWNCAEIYSQQNFGYGSYVWQIEGRPDQLDPNIVLGLFNYKAGDDGHHEVDIEFARWGNSQWPNFNYTVYPAYGNPETRDSKTYELALNGTYSTYKFTRTSQQVAYKSYHGHTQNEANAFYAYNTPAGFPVSTEALPVHMNLWLFSGHAPINGQEVEIIIHSFKFTPQ
ncbi:hypothetical protein HDE69_004059 [Pedobacter cryoconitis]|uniref:GH16 domain-containing protein n=1 Tax=Pedobacter cryoconitis TaxID=188932 RepID=A0A7W8YW87_9SPHI|nr:glycoside hydrolase family 16 protein [Pedobacter cryoconitis]MBB5622977.1 hypothetical protein [Pedobacter cryoconitis]